MAKYNVGDEVEVSFMGTVSQVSINYKGNVEYQVKYEIEKVSTPTAMFLTETNIFELPKP